MHMNICGSVSDVTRGSKVIDAIGCMFLLSKLLVLIPGIFVILLKLQKACILGNVVDGGGKGLTYPPGRE